MRKPVKVGGLTVPTSIAKFFRGGLADTAALRQQSPLPETAVELCKIAKLNRASEGSVYLGKNATERQIKFLSSNGALAKARIVHFATHDLLAGESKEILNAKAEPGLILTPPSKASEFDDGLLTASEITLLKLNADWVILSACNTAGGGEEGAQALSGLARAFFYAGTRSLLVSHWAVDSHATVKLITGALSHTANNKEIGRSEALRRAMMELLENGAPYEAHPSYWAPFVLVGEGAPAADIPATVNGDQHMVSLGSNHKKSTSAHPTNPSGSTSKTKSTKPKAQVTPLPKHRPRRARKPRKQSSVKKKELKQSPWEAGSER